MKHFYTLLIFLAIASASAQIVPVPNANFKAKLLAADLTNEIATDINGAPAKIDTNNDSEIQVSEALAIYGINTSGPTANAFINSMAGIEYFINLKKFDCTGYYNPALNVTMLTHLEELICKNSTQMSTLNIAGLTSLKKLDCSGNFNLDTVNVSGLTALQYLYCYGIGITALNVSGLTNLIELDCHYNQITSLNLAGFTSLKKLYCDSNNLAVLNLSGLTALETVDCHLNNIAALNLTGANAIKDLNCQGNDITTLNLAGKNALESLNTNQTNLTSLDVSGHTVLKYLKCMGNGAYPTVVSLSSINLTGCTGLLEMDCSNNKLATLNVLPAVNLQNLNCSFNAMTALNTAGLSALQILNCSYSGITALNLSGNLNLWALDAQSTNVTFLDLSPLTLLMELNLNYAEHLEILLLKNGITTDGMSPTPTYYFSGTPNLKYVCVSEGLISYMEQMIDSYGYTSCELNTYCNFVPGGTYFTIGGDYRFDGDANGCDASDVKMPYMKVKVVSPSSSGNVTGYVIGNGTGSYFIPVQAGTHTLTPVLDNPAYFTVSPAMVNITFPASATPYTQNFCVTPNGSHPDLKISLLPVTGAVPGFNVKYRIVYANVGTQIQSGNLLMTYPEDVLDFMSATTAPSQSAGSLSWAFSNLKPFETRIVDVTLNLNSPVETPAVNGGFIVDMHALISSGLTDQTPEDNLAILNQTVVNALDPNDKTCLEGNFITPEMAGKYVHYIIRFENTGTSPAQNIVVKDMIDITKFDVSSLVPLDGSHPFTTRITDNNKIEFIFEGINLPFNDANNDGYLMFGIKTLPSLWVGDTFSNTASIYFDYNAPIVTPPAVTTLVALGTPDFAFDNYFTLYPNPANDGLNIKAKADINLTSINIYNTLGQLVLVVPNAKGIESIDVSNLTTGNYFIKITSDKGSANARFVKN